MKTYSKENIIDLLYGCTVVGTGGGGGLKEGLKMMEEDFQLGRELKVISADEVPDDAYIATPYGCGAPTPEDGGESDPRYARLPIYDGNPAILALKALEESMNVNFYALSSTELGGMNTAEALHIACTLGLPIVDGDPAGRSVPELQHSTYFINNIPIAPMGLATKFGDVAVLKNVVDDFRAEDMVRAMAVASDNIITVVDHPMTGKQYRESVIVGAISYALEIGETLRFAKEAGESVPEKIAEKFDGKILFKGEVTDTPWELRDGFNFGDLYIKGEKEFDGDEYRIWFKNENLMSYKNGNVDVTCPDLICLFDEEGIPVTNPDAKVGMKVTVLGLPAPEMWKSEAGVACFGPKHFGFDVEYVPMKK